MSNKTKKLLILNLPYFIAGLVCTNLGEAWRIAEGADMSEKLPISSRRASSSLEASVSAG